MRTSSEERSGPGPRIHGVDVDARGRCAHYGSPRDVVAIRFPCCGRFYACHACHAAREAHPAQRWTVDEFERRAVLCGVCRERFPIRAYLDAVNRCPRCRAPFNPGCGAHHHLYFALPGELDFPGELELPGELGLSGEEETRAPPS